MRKLFIALAVGSALALTGCASFKGGSSGGGVPSQSDVSKVIAKVQTATHKICQFVPTAQTISAILATFGLGSAGEITGIAAQVCAAVTKAQSARGGAYPTVRGVEIRGRFRR